METNAATKHSTHEARAARVGVTVGSTWWRGALLAVPSMILDGSALLSFERDTWAAVGPVDGVTFVRTRLGAMPLDAFVAAHSRYQKI